MSSRYTVKSKAFNGITAATNELVVHNNGNTSAKPAMTLYGTGTITISLNGEQIFIVKLGNEGFITIDTDAMEAYKDGILKNRLVTGDYDNFALNVGKNIISITGTVRKVDIANFSRWI